jgi:DNA end-binding protein Ku
LRQLVKDKLKGKKIIAAPEGPTAGGNVVDLMEALRKSVASKTKPKAKSGKKSA